MKHEYYVETESGATDNFTRIDEARKFAQTNGGGKIYRDYDETDNSPEVFETVEGTIVYEDGWHTLVQGDVDASVKIEDGKPVRVSVSPADTSSEIIRAIEGQLAEKFPGYEADPYKWHSPQGEDCVVVVVEEAQA